MHKVQKTIKDYNGYKTCTIKSVTNNQWATPIVPVVKSNGKIPLCGDFKVTIKMFLKVEK